MTSEEYIKELTLIFKGKANPENALLMEKYLLNQLSFFGIIKPVRSAIINLLFLKAKEGMTESRFIKTATLLWKKGKGIPLCSD